MDFNKRFLIHLKRRDSDVVDVRVHGDAVLADVSHNQMIVRVDGDARAVSKEAFSEPVHALALMGPDVDLILAAHSNVVVVENGDTCRLAHALTNLPIDGSNKHCTSRKLPVTATGHNEMGDLASTRYSM